MAKQRTREVHLITELRLIILSFRRAKPQLTHLAINASALFAAEMVARLANALYTMVMVRHLSPADYGAYTALLSYVMIGGLVAEFGVSQVLIRDIAQHPDRSSELLVSGLAITLPLALLASFGVAAAGVIAGSVRSLHALLTLTCLAIFGNLLIALAGAVLRAFERMEILSLINAAVLLLSTALGMVWLRMGAGLPQVVLLYMATVIVNAAVLLLIVLRSIPRLRIAHAWRKAWPLLLQAAPIGVLGLCGAILARLNVVLLSSARGTTEAGLFAAALFLVETLTVVITSVVGAAFPVLSRQWQRSAFAMLTSYEAMLRVFMLFSAGACAGIFILADRIILLLYRTPYLPSATCLKILVWSFLFNALSGPAGMLLIVTKDRLKQIIPYSVGITLLSVALNLWLIPAYSYVAASVIVTVIAFMLLVAKMAVLSKMLPAQPRWAKISLRPILAALLMAGLLGIVSPFPLWAVITIGAAGYLLALLALGEFKGEYVRLQRFLAERQL